MKVRFIMPLHHWEHVLEAGTGKVSMAKLLIDGKKVLFHHWGPKGVITPELELAWKEANIVVCCYPKLLPDLVRAKHLVPDTEGTLYTHPTLHTKNNMVHVEF